MERGWGRKFVDLRSLGEGEKVPIFVFMLWVSVCLYERERERETNGSNRKEMGTGKEYISSSAKRGGCKCLKYCIVQAF